MKRCGQSTARSHEVLGVVLFTKAHVRPWIDGGSVARRSLDHEGPLFLCCDCANTRSAMSLLDRQYIRALIFCRLPIFLGTSARFSGLLCTKQDRACKALKLDRLGLPRQVGIKCSIRPCRAVVASIQTESRSVGHGLRNTPT
jgi:hypothetical protein